MLLSVVDIIIMQSKHHIMSHGYRCDLRENRLSMCTMKINCLSKTAHRHHESYTILGYDQPAIDLTTEPFR